MTDHRHLAVDTRAGRSGEGHAFAPSAGGVDERSSAAECENPFVVIDQRQTAPRPAYDPGARPYVIANPDPACATAISVESSARERQKPIEAGFGGALSSAESPASQHLRMAEEKFGTPVTQIGRQLLLGHFGVVQALRWRRRPVR